MFYSLFYLPTDDALKFNYNQKDQFIKQLQRINDLLKNNLLCLHSNYKFITVNPIKLVKTLLRVTSYEDIGLLL